MANGDDDAEMQDGNAATPIAIIDKEDIPEETAEEEQSQSNIMPYENGTHAPNGPTRTTIGGVGISDLCIL